MAGPVPTTRVNLAALLLVRSPCPRPPLHVVPTSHCHSSLLSPVDTIPGATTHRGLGWLSRVGPIPKPLLLGLVLEFPPAVVDAGKGKTAEARKTWLEEQGMILKQTFW